MKREIDNCVRNRKQLLWCDYLRHELEDTRRKHTQTHKQWCIVYVNGSPSKAIITRREGWVGSALSYELFTQRSRGDHSPGEILADERSMRYSGGIYFGHDSTWDILRNFSMLSFNKETEEEEEVITLTIGTRRERVHIWLQAVS